jgi:non-heme chloroperoxidase
VDTELLVAGLVVQAYAAPIQHSDTGRFKLKEQTIKLANGIQLTYAERGNANNKTVLFVHGYTDSWHSFEKVLTLVPENMHAIAITLRGHGNSSKPAKGYDPKTFANDIAAFITAKKLGTCILAGHSMGGLVVQQFAIDFPKLTKSIIIISSDASFADNKGLPELVHEVMSLRDPIEYAFAEGFQKSTLARPVDTLFINKCIAESMKLPASVWHACASAILKADLTKELHKIGVPVLIFWGSKDSFCSQADQENLVKQIKNAKLVVYQETGHALHWEEPERFAKDLVQFLNTL